MPRFPLRALAPALSALALLCAVPSSAKAESPYCREYTRTVWIGGQMREAYGTACLQPDGAWQSVNERPTVPPYETRFEAPGNPYPAPAAWNDPFPDEQTYRRTVIVHHSQPVVIYRDGPPYGWGRWRHRFDSPHDHWGHNRWRAHDRNHPSERDCPWRHSRHRD